MNYFSIKPEETLIFEDSDVGIEAAIKSKANIFKVEIFWFKKEGKLWKYLQL